MAVTAEVLGVIILAWECSCVRGLQQHQVHKTEKGSQFLSVSGLLPFTSCLKEDSMALFVLCLLLDSSFCQKWFFQDSMYIFWYWLLQKEGKMCVC